MTLRIRPDVHRDPYQVFTPDEVGWVVDYYVARVGWGDLGGCAARTNDSRIFDNGGGAVITISPGQSITEQYISLFHEIFHLIFDWFYDLPIDLEPFVSELHQLGKELTSNSAARDGYIELLNRIGVVEEWCVEEEAWRFLFSYPDYTSVLFSKLLNQEGS